MNQSAYETLSQLNLPDVCLISLADFEDKELIKAKQNRTLIEYYFTCTPSLPLFILNHYPEVDIITYLDADLFFFSDLSPIYEEFSHHSIAIIEHRFPQNLCYLAQEFGVYNVGWLSFRRDENGLACLCWWRERCLEWCYDRPENGRFADQKYLDDWPNMFQNVISLRHKGSNLAPWNLVNYKIRANEDRVSIDEYPLIFFHFQGFKQLKDWLYDPQTSTYQMRLSKITRQHIYGPYIQELTDINRQLSVTTSSRLSQKGLRNQSVKSFPHPVEQLLDTLRIIKGILRRKYIFVINKWVI